MYDLLYPSAGSFHCTGRTVSKNYADPVRSKSRKVPSTTSGTISLSYSWLYRSLHQIILGSFGTIERRKDLNRKYDVSVGISEAGYITIVEVSHRQSVQHPIIPTRSLCLPYALTRRPRPPNQNRTSPRPRAAVLIPLQHQARLPSVCREVRLALSRPPSPAAPRLCLLRSLHRLHSAKAVWATSAQRLWRNAWSRLALSLCLEVFASADVRRPFRPFEGSTNGQNTRLDR